MPRVTTLGFFVPDAEKEELRFESKDRSSGGPAAG